ncbi:MAG TPA: nuclear transport factor 2 family protein [Steroidobacteraceae bacterium]|nr:nuclear transport factor 2 family protein [Steroidobacteraceae bacterium]
MKLVSNLFAVAALIVCVGAQAKDLTAQDIVEIQTLYAKYNQVLDAGKAEAWADTFTPDGVFNKTNVGRDALITFAKNFYDQGGGKRRHWNTNLVLTGTSDGADGSVYLTLWDVGNRPATILVTGIYEDKLVKTKDGWRFKTRVVNPDTPRAPTAATTPTAPAAPTGVAAH